MPKTLDDYMNDPDIINEPMGLRIAHAMRFKVRDETANMTTAEKVEHINKRAADMVAPMGKTLCYDLVRKDNITFDDAMPEYGNSHSNVVAVI